MQGSGSGAATSGWRNWAGDQSATPAAFERPGSVEEIASAVLRAGERGMRVRVAGSGHSFGDAVCTDGMLMSLQAMAGLLDVDRSSGLVRVQAGITIGRLCALLAEHGLAMENLGDIDVQSIAGAVSTATHGTGARLQNLSSQLAEVTLVLADGSVMRCSPERDPEAFAAARVGLGALGVIAEVSLRCVPAFTLEGVDSKAPLAQTLASFQEMALANDHYECYAFPYSPTALTRTNNRTEQPPRPPGRLSAYFDDVLMTNHAFGALCRLSRRAPSHIPRINRLVTALASGRRRVDSSHRIFTSPRLVRFTEMEYALPRARTAEAVRRVMELVERERMAVPFPIEVRTVAADDALLSTASGRDSGFVAVHMFEGMPWREYFEAVEAIMDELDGRPHWGKRHFQTAERLRGRYPDWDRFQAVRARLDPHGLFSNAWTDRVLGPVRAPSGAGAAGG